MSLSEIIRADPELHQVHQKIQSLHAEMMGTTDPVHLSQLKAERDELFASEEYKNFKKVQDDYHLKRGD